MTTTKAVCRDCGEPLVYDEARYAWTHRAKREEGDDHWPRPLIVKAQQREDENMLRALHGDR